MTMIPTPQIDGDLLRTDKGARDLMLTVMDWIERWPLLATTEMKEALAELRPWVRTHPKTPLAGYPATTYFRCAAANIKTHINIYARESQRRKWPNADISMQIALVLWVKALLSVKHKVPLHTMREDGTFEEPAVLTKLSDTHRGLHVELEARTEAAIVCVRAKLAAQAGMI